MPEIGLDGSGIDAVVGQLEPTGMAKHVRVELHVKPRSRASALHHGLVLAYRHGLRASELVDLRWEQIDLEHALLHVRRPLPSVPA